MNHLPRIFGHRKQAKGMDPKKIRRKPKLERRNAAKHFDYDAGSSSSSLDSSSAFASASASASGSLLYTRSMEFYDRTSFRIEGVEGEFDRICRSLGLSGPEDFAIPAAAWEAMKVRSASDILPRLKLNEFDEAKEKEEEIEVAEVELGDGCGVRVPIKGLDECARHEPAETSGCGTAATAGGGGGGIKGFRPPMLKPPPGIRVSVVDNMCSTWDLLRDFAPQGEEERKEGYGELSGSDDDRESEEEEARREEEGGGEIGGARSKREEEENAARIAEIVAELSGSCSFTTSNEDDSSSTTTDPRSNNISPNGRIKRIITAGNWQKGELLGRGSFGSVYEGISE